MKRYNWNDFISPLIIGFVLYCLDIVLSILPYKTDSTEAFIFFLVLIFIVSAILIIFALLHKKTRILIVILRSFICFCSYISVFAINGYMGTLYRIYDIMNIAINIERNNSSGLLTLTFTFFLLIIEIVTILTFAIIQKTKKHINKK